MKKEVEPEAGWIPGRFHLVKPREQALGGGDPQEAGRGSLLGPVRKDKKTIGFADTKSASASAQTTEKAYLLQVRANQYW